MDRLSRYVPPRSPAATAATAVADAENDPEKITVPSRLTFRRQAMDIGVIGATLFAAIIVLNESANRQWSVAMGPSYRKGQQYAAVAANWAQRKFSDAKNSLRPLPAPSTQGQAEPEVMLALEDLSDAPRLEDPAIEVLEEAPSVPTVGTLRLQQVGRSRTIHSRPIDPPETPEQYRTKSGPPVDDFPVRIRLE